MNKDERTLLLITAKIVLSLITMFNFEDRTIKLLVRTIKRVQDNG